MLFYKKEIFTKSDILIPLNQYSIRNFNPEVIKKLLDQFRQYFTKTDQISQYKKEKIGQG